MAIMEKWYGGFSNNNKNKEEDDKGEEESCISILCISLIPLLPILIAQCQNRSNS